MSIRSYKQIYQKFEDMFPELASRKTGWKGVLFRAHYILIMLNDGSHIHFYYDGDHSWRMQCIPAAKQKQE